MAVATPEEPHPQRTMITLCVLLATVMTALDTTIANVALPHMAGSVSASSDQITWVLTSYLVASAIMTPMSGWLAGRFGRRNIFIVAIVGFTIASALCGAAQTLLQIVLFRVLQGILGAAIPPLSQAVMLDIFPLEERGPAMSLFGMGVMVAPVVGPVLGGWLTDDFSWRWVFYINLPIGMLCLIGIFVFMPKDTNTVRRRFDVTGFALLSLALAALQLMLDRGQNNDWFNSSETVIEAAVTVVSVILFLIHSILTDRPFVPLEIFTDRNFVTATLIGVMVGVIAFSVLALLPPMAENLLGYPVVTTGWVTAPRGVGAVMSMFIAGKLVGRIDNRLLMLIGLIIYAGSFLAMSHFSLEMDAREIVATGLVQGLATGLLFTPMTILAFGTLPSDLRADGTGFFTLARNTGNSLGISIMQAVYITEIQVVHARLAAGTTPDNPLMRAPFLPQAYSLSSSAGAAAFNAEITRQAAMVSNVDVFHLMFAVTLMAAPLVLLLKPPRTLSRVEIPVEH